MDRPVNVLALRTAPPVTALASVGVARVSVGGHFAFNALGALLEAATELREQGTYGFTERSAAGSRAARAVFSGSSDSARARLPRAPRGALSPRTAAAAGSASPARSGRCRDSRWGR